MQCKSRWSNPLFEGRKQKRKPAQDLEFGCLKRTHAPTTEVDVTSRHPCSRATFTVSATPPSKSANHGSGLFPARFAPPNTAHCEVLSAPGPWLTRRIRKTNVPKPVILTLCVAIFPLQRSPRHSPIYVTADLPTSFRLSIFLCHPPRVVQPLRNPRNRREFGIRSLQVLVHSCRPSPKSTKTTTPSTTS